MSLAVMGVDPGGEGAVSVLSTTAQIIHVQKFSPGMTRGEFKEIMREAVRKLRTAGSEVAYLEKVQYIGRRKDGQKADGGQGAFTFGRIYGWCETALTHHDLDLRDVYPMIWQGRLGCLSGGNKNVTKRKAIELFGSQVKVTHAIADSLLIAEYGRRRLATADL